MFFAKQFLFWNWRDDPSIHQYSDKTCDFSQSNRNLGSITSHCSGKWARTHLPKGQTGRVRFPLLVSSANHVTACRLSSGKDCLINYSITSNKSYQMADDVEKMDLAFERVLDSFKLQNLNLVKGQDVFIIKPTGSGKSLRHRHALTCPAVCSDKRIKDRTRETAEFEPNRNFISIVLSTNINV